MTQGSVTERRFDAAPERHSTAAARASVVVPAHDEAAVIDRCLEALLADAAPGEFDVVVVANGCTDATLARTRRALSRMGHAGTVLDLAEASKARALRAGDAVAATYPRVYVDADVVCPTSTLRALVAALDEPGVALAVPQRRLELGGASRTARLYYQQWARSPRVEQMLAGRGCYALSRAGHDQLGDFPLQVADDLFVTTAVPRSAARIVDGQVRIFPPGDLGAVLKVRTRIYAGNAALGLVPQARTDVGAVRWRRSLTHPASWPGLLVYGAVTALAKASARRARTGEGPAWGRDATRGRAMQQS